MLSWWSGVHATVGILMGGCSFIGMRVPAPETAATAKCSGVLPAVDAALALGGITTAVIAAQQDYDPNAPEPSVVPMPLVGIAIVSAGVVGVIAAVSTVYGLNRLGHCRTLRTVARDAQESAGMFCTTSPVAPSVCFCATASSCDERRRAIEAHGGIMTACVSSPTTICRSPADPPSTPLASPE